MVTWEDKCPNSTFPLSSFFHQLLLLSTTSRGVGKSLWPVQVSWFFPPPSSLCNPSPPTGRTGQYMKLKHACCVQLLDSNLCWAQVMVIFWYPLVVVRDGYLDSRVKLGQKEATAHVGIFQSLVTDCGMPVGHFWFKKKIK